MTAAVSSCIAWTVLLLVVGRTSSGADAAVLVAQTQPVTFDPVDSWQTVGCARAEPAGGARCGRGSYKLLVPALYSTVDVETAPIRYRYSEDGISGTAAEVAAACARHNDCVGYALGDTTYRLFYGVDGGNMDQSQQSRGRCGVDTRVCAEVTAVFAAQPGLQTGWIENAGIALEARGTRITDPTTGRVLVESDGPVFVPFPGVNATSISLRLWARSVGAEVHVFGVSVGGVPSGAYDAGIGGNIVFSVLVSTAALAFMIYHAVWLARRQRAARRRQRDEHNNDKTD